MVDKRKMMAKQPTMREIFEKQKKEIEDEDGISSTYMMSDVDDKNDPNFFPKDERYFDLPRHVRLAIENGKLKAKHSDFYYRLTDLSMKIDIYNKFFKTSIPSYQMGYFLKRIREKDKKQKKEREEFEHTVHKKKPMRFNSSMNLFALESPKSLSPTRPFGK